MQLAISYAALNFGEGVEQVAIRAGHNRLVWDYLGEVLAPVSGIWDSRGIQRPVFAGRLQCYIKIRWVFISAGVDSQGRPAPSSNGV